MYAHDIGWLLGRRFLQLTHTGRRTGRRHTTVLEVIGTSAAGELLVLSGFGARADWVRNLEAGGPASVTVGRRTSTAAHRVLDGGEATAALADYERRHRLVAPVVRAVLSRLLGRRYRGTPEQRRLLAARLPVLALRPGEPAP